MHTHASHQFSMTWLGSCMLHVSHLLYCVMLHTNLHTCGSLFTWDRPNLQIGYSTLILHYQTHSIDWQGAQRGSLVWPTSHYLLKVFNYGPLIVINTFQGMELELLSWEQRDVYHLDYQGEIGFVLGTLKEPSDKMSKGNEAWLTFQGMIKYGYGALSPRNCILDHVHW